MTYRVYCTVSGALFAVVALAHLGRLVLGWSISIEGTAVPMWVSIAGAVIAAVLAGWAFRLNSRSRS